MWSRCIFAASSDFSVCGPSSKSLAEESTFRISMMLIQFLEAGEIWMNSPPILLQARWNSCPFKGAMMNTCMFLRRIRSAMSCMVKVLPAPEVPRIAMFAFL